ncbi:hypothetical protein BE221DRAFT_169808, partial [Ostreococcus tauri]
MGRREGTRVDDARRGDARSCRYFCFTWIFSHVASTTRATTGPDARDDDPLGVFMSLTTRPRRIDAWESIEWVPARAISASARRRNARVTHRESTMATSFPPSMAYSPSNSTSSTNVSNTASSHSNRPSSSRSFFTRPLRSSCACTMAFTATRSSGTHGTTTS